MGIFSKAKLTDLQTGKEYRLGKVRIGTSSDCDIVVPAEYAGISPLHAEISSHKDHYALSKGHDLGAEIYYRTEGTGWTFMERRVSFAHIDENTEIQLGGSAPHPMAEIPGAKAKKMVAEENAKEGPQPEKQKLPGYLLRLEI